MAKNLQKKADLLISQGTVITGKWNKKQYVVTRKIGAGMVGTVYLCKHKGNDVALKISDQSVSMTSEVNVLKALNKVQDNRLGPFLLDVDDWEAKNGKVYSFYIMNYVKGVSLEKFVKQNGYEWIGVFLIQMLDQLEKLHELGWVFGDLKNDNILIDPSPPKVQFIDVGGTTKIGRSIKEYSEFYDRAYWQLGTREAEPSYDLFAVVMVVMAIFYPQKFKRTNHSRRLLLHKLNSIKELQPFSRSLQKALLGKYRHARQMKDDVIETLAQKQPKKNNKRSSYLKEAFFISLISGMYYIFSQIIF